MTSIENSYQHHPPKEGQSVRYEEIRRKGEEFALLIEALCPKSRERSLAQTNLEQAVMWANKSIAVNE